MGPGGAGAGESRGMAGVAPRLVGAGPRPGPQLGSRGQEGREGRVSPLKEGLPEGPASVCGRREGRAEGRQPLAPGSARWKLKAFLVQRSPWRMPGVRSRWVPLAFQAGRLQRAGLGRLAQSCPQPVNSFGRWSWSWPRAGTPTAWVGPGRSSSC